MPNFLGIEMHSKKTILLNNRGGLSVEFTVLLIVIILLLSYLLQMVQFSLARNYIASLASNAAFELRTKGRSGYQQYVSNSSNNNQVNHLYGISNLEFTVTNIAGLKDKSASTTAYANYDSQAILVKVSAGYNILYLFNQRPKDSLVINKYSFGIQRSNYQQEE